MVVRQWGTASRYGRGISTVGRGLFFSLSSRWYHALELKKMDEWVCNEEGTRTVEGIWLDQ